jgi:hypothetical protein
MDYIDDESTDAAVVAKLTQLADGNLAAQVIKLDDGRTFGIRRNDIAFDNLTPANAAEVFAPKTIALTTQLQTAGALEQYLDRFKDADSIMFADVQTSKITAILDYHKRPMANVDIPEDVKDADAIRALPAVPRHSAHRSILQLRHSQEWEAWTAQAKKGLVSHTDFINFLEENSFDIASPDPVLMVENCRDMRGAENGEITSSVRAGAVQTFSYRQDNKVESAEFPVEFAVNISIYFGDAPTTFRVMTRYMFKSGVLTLGIKILRLERERQDAFMAIVKEISENTGVEALLGNPA